MSTVAEIIEAVKRLDEGQKGELLEKLAESILTMPGIARSKPMRNRASSIGFGIKRSET